MEKLNLTFPSALALALGIYYFCTVLATKTKSKLPALLTASIIFLVGYWTILPLDFVETSKMTVVYSIAMVAVMVNIGSLFDLKQLKQDWRVVIVTLLGMLAMGIVVWLVATPLFGKKTAIAAIPPIAGGGIAANLMSAAAIEAGYPELAVLAIMVLTLQGFVGMPLMSTGLRKEAIRLAENYRNGIVEETEITLSGDSKGKSRMTFRDRIPTQYRNQNYYIFYVFFLGAVAAWLGTYTSAWTGGLLTSTIVCVILGAVAQAVGIIEKDPFTKSGIMTFMMTAISINTLSGLNQATVEIVLKQIFPLGVTLLVASAAVLLVNGLTAKYFGYSKYMAIAIASNMFLGFPRNNLITEEVVTAMGQTPEEVEYLRGILLPKIILGGIVSVSITSVIIAGIFVGML